MISALLALALHATPGTFCGEAPTKKPARSIGSPSKGAVEGAVPLEDSDAARVLPVRHKARCLNFGTPRLVAALTHAGRAVQDRIPRTPALGVGDLGRAKGGAIPPYSHSHQAGRDVDLAFYVRDAKGQPVAAEDLTHFDRTLTSGGLKFDVERNWALVLALISDPSIDLRWLFVSEPLASALLDEAARQKTEASLISRARELLHQPSDAPPHDDHLHLRIRCTKDEREAGCSDG